MPRDNRCMYMAHVVFMSVVVTVWAVCGNVCCVAAIVSSCRYCIFVSCVHAVAVLNAAFCMNCSLLILVGDARGEHMEEAYSRAGLMTV